MEANNQLSFNEITELMLKEEKFIASLNKKYNYNVELDGTIKEREEFAASLKRWDDLKAQRNLLKTV